LFAPELSQYAVGVSCAGNDVPNMHDARRQTVNVNP